MANPLDIVYSRKNADGNGFNEKILIPVPGAAVVCDACGDLTTYTGSFGGATISASYSLTASYAVSASYAPGGLNIEVTSSDTNYYVPFVTNTGSNVLYIDTSSIYYNPALDSLIVPYVVGTASFAVSASYPLPSSPPDLSAYLSSSWTGSNSSRFFGTSSLAISASWAPTPTSVPSASFASSSLTSSHLSDAGYGKQHIAVSTHTVGARTTDIGTAYSQVFSVTLPASQSVYVRLTAHGFLARTGSIVFTGEYFLQYDNGLAQPGRILHEYNNNAVGIEITSQLLDPAAYADAVDIFPIRLLNSSNVSIPVILTYEVKGLYSAINQVLNLGAITFSSGSISGSGDTFEGYSPESPVVSTLDQGTGFAGSFVITSSYYGNLIDDPFDYTTGSFTSGTGGWVVS